MNLPFTLKKPAKIGKYELRRTIGKGAMGTVYEAFDPFIQRPVAIKISHKYTGDDETVAQRIRESFFSEVYTSGRMHHPTVIQIYDAGVEDDKNYIVMEYVSGFTLQEYVLGKRQLAPEQVIDVVYQCAKGLDYVHRQGIIHRDIKPGNIMLSHEGEVKIMDFSIAHMDLGWEGDDYDHSHVQGSPMYMPPEQLTEEKRLVVQSDIYSLGAVMYALLARAPLYRATNLESLIYQITNLEPEPLDELRPDLSGELVRVVNRAMSKIIYDRYDTALDFANALSNLYGRLHMVGEKIDMQEKWRALRQLSFFKDFNDAQLTEIVDVCEWSSYGTGDVILSEGEMGNAFYVISSGSVQVRSGGKPIGMFEAGECFGEISYVRESPRSSTFAAKTDVSLMKISASLLDRLTAETQLHYYKVFLQNLIARLSHTNNELSKSQSRD